MSKQFVRNTLCAAVGLVLAGSALADGPDPNRVIVTFAPGAAAQVENALRGARGDVHRRLESLNAIAVSVPPQALDGLRNNPNILNIEQDAPRYLLALYNDDPGNPATTQLTPYAIYQSQANQLALNMASAKKVCVIDSGLAYLGQGETGGANPDFSATNITGSNDSGTGNWYQDGGPHGTHVAGTVAALDNGFGVVGMAPGNPMHIVKVFNAAGWGYSSDLAHAASKCSEAGAKIITMSLGGGGANSTERNAFDQFTAAGGLVLAAAGNDGNSVRSYPAGYKSVMMIGANDANNQIADFSQFPGCTVTSGRGRNATTETDDGYCVEATAGGVDTLSTYPSGGATLSTLEAGGAGFASSAMENLGAASGATFFMGTAESTNSGAAGKVCVIDRGVISFHDKVQNCQNSGGIGAIIINNVAGMLYGTLGSPNNTSIPAVGAAFEDRAALLAAASASISIGSSDYGYMSGTSMATPGVAGVAALVWSNHPTCTGAQIRDALKNTAEDAGTPGKDVYFGYGIVKAKLASDFLTANGCGGGNEPPPASAPDSLTGSVSRKGKNYQYRLNWNGGGATVDIFRNGSKVATQNNTGSFNENLSVTSANYQVCNAGTTSCSATVTVTY
ncbi:S8 family serine peptidase [Pseudomarimonas salicorniae]|uniref:S8 family serine peptidase n=1 Tax=Pseudomarimonas salicorniae TaxID=2933270 RepID=A0ABT0GHG2_9GAMM|nr:S8 family serine peptidase [Lysobacter sp. CAU 1642]MCK7593974.1 S8 family serine peptidase [Lysobacter sp. CAU 1642]